MRKKIKQYIRSLSDNIPSNKYYKHNGVRIEKRNFIKDYFGWGSGEDPSREGGIVKSHESLTRRGDSVVVVGGGTGITGIRAAKIVGDRGEVTIFEGGRESVQRIEEVLRMNNVNDRCNVFHTIVGRSDNVYGGSQEKARYMSPSEIPNCDVLELDCEGAEILIIKNITFNPRVLIVELHPWNFDEEYEEVLGILSEKGYEVEGCYGHEGNRVANQSAKEMHISSRESYEVYVNDVTVGDVRRMENGARWPMVISLSLCS
ncbi:hypothetical protein GGQ00_003076 [Salinibacter ruber]|nr:hypothetical protein [Salinibacter ruber]